MKTNTVRYVTNFLNQLLKQHNGEVYITLGVKRYHVVDILKILEDSETIIHHKKTEMLKKRGLTTNDNLAKSVDFISGVDELITELTKNA